MYLGPSTDSCYLILGAKIAFFIHTMKYKDFTGTYAPVKLVNMMSLGLWLAEPLRRT